MQRARRLASVVAIALTGVCVLSACRADPEVAAYVGDKRITEAEVSRLVQEATVDTDAQGEVRAPTRAAVVGSLVLDDLCARLSAEKGYRSTREASREQVAQVLGVKPESTYVEATTRLYTCLSGLPQAQPVQPTDAEIAELVALGRSIGAVPATMTDQEAARQLDDDTLRGALGTRKAITEAVAGYDVTVNPRYRPLEFPLLSFKDDVAAVSVPLGGADSGMVTRAR